MAALASEGLTSLVAVSGNARVGKSTLLNELVSVAAPSTRLAPPFKVGASDQQVTAGIDVFVVPGPHQGATVTFLDTEGRGGHGQEHDARVVALPFSSASSLLFFSQGKPAAVVDTLKALASIVTSTLGFLEAQPLPHLALCFQDCDVPAEQAGGVGARVFGTAWPGGGAAVPCPRQDLADLVARSFSSISVHFIPHVDAQPARGAAVRELWGAVAARLRAPEAGDKMAGVLGHVLAGVNGKKRVHVPSVFSAVLRQAGQARWEGALRELVALDARAWKAAWKARGCVMDGGALLEHAAATSAPRAPLSLAQARPLLASLRASAADEAAVEAAVRESTLAPLRARVETWVSEERAVLQAEENRKRREREAAEEAAQRERLRQEQAAAAAAEQLQRRVEAEARAARERVRAAEQQRLQAEADREEAQRAQQPVVRPVVMHGPFGPVVAYQVVGGGWPGLVGPPHPMMHPFSTHFRGGHPLMRRW